MSREKPFAWRARWIFPVEGPPLENATIEIADGLIVGLHDRRDPRAVDLGNVAMIPGLVNAHTHLELSDVARPLTPAEPFTDWLRAVIGHRRARPATPAAAAERMTRGHAESTDAGTLVVGDIIGPNWLELPASAFPPRGVAFLELIGLNPQRVAEEEGAAQRFLGSERVSTTPEDNQPANGRDVSPTIAPTRLSASPCVRGLSPHAPYSVHPDLIRAAVDLADERRVPLAIHLAETTAELQLLRDGTGEFRTFLEELGVWNPAAFADSRRPLDFLEALAPLDRALVIHGNYLADDELQFLSRHPNISVVYCPRTHAYFGHAPHPWRDMLSRGINVSLGTDSRASNPDLSLWNEMRFLHRRFSEVSGALLLKMGTLNGARSLGCDAHTGSLTAGKRADLAAVPLPAAASADPYELLFASPGRPSILTVPAVDDD
jgi:aminodeoxyfutalosine deaminase